jgi:hypothetical protein
MKDVKIYYSASGVISISIAILAGLVVCPFILEIMLISPIKWGRTGAIYFLIGAIIVQISVIPVLFMIAVCLKSLHKKQPALELTQDYYIDHMENVKVSWNNITKVWILKGPQSFLKLTLLDNSTVTRKASRMSKYIFFMNNLNSSGGPLSINMALLKGKNKEILRIINEYQMKVLSRGENTALLT